MNSEKIFAHLITKGVYLLFCVSYVFWLSFTWFPLLDWTIYFAKPYSWFVRLPVFLCFGIASTMIVLVGAIPLFWLDKVKRKRKGWLGSLFLQLESQ